MISHASRQMLSLMEAQAQFFQQGHQSLSELDEYRRKLNEEVTAGSHFLCYTCICTTNLAVIMWGTNTVFDDRPGTVQINK